MHPSEAIEKLLSTGHLTETQIGERVGARQSTINRIRHRKLEPKYELGKALVDWAEETPPEDPEHSRRTLAADDRGAAQADGVPVQPLKRAA
jgi:predicted transcriptional regulator